jgi:hypothetical protein
MSHQGAGQTAGKLPVNFMEMRDGATDNCPWAPASTRTKYQS